MSSHSCPACGGDGNHIGTLGHTRHYKCRDCGAPFSFTPKRCGPKPARVPALTGGGADARFVRHLHKTGTPLYQY